MPTLSGSHLSSLGQIAAILGLPEAQQRLGEMVAFPEKYDQGFVDGIIQRIMLPQNFSKLPEQAQQRFTSEFGGMGGVNPLVQGAGGAPGGLNDILRVLGQDVNLGNLTPQELSGYFNVATEPDYASGNLMRAIGIAPNQGNPMAEFLQGTVPNLYRQSDLYNTFVGQASPARAGQPAGEESLGQSLGQTLGSFRSGATSRFNPTEGADFFRNLSSLMGRVNADPTQGTVGQNTLATNMVSPDNAWQAMMDSVGGGLSPLLQGRGVQNATRQRLYDTWRNQGAGGNSFMDYLARMV